VEFVYTTLHGQVRSHHLDHPLLALIRQQVPHPHDQGKVGVGGKGVGKPTLAQPSPVVAVGFVAIDDRCPYPLDSD
jgi:hypothetical protein